jgi:hypothetical protein
MWKNKEIEGKQIRNQHAAYWIKYVVYRFDYKKKQDQRIRVDQRTEI